jgi:hypothetical protein
MGPIHLNIDPVLIEELLVGTIGTVAATVGVIAAVAVSREARTKGKTIETIGGLPPVLGNRLSMTVGGGGSMWDPLNLHFSLADPAVTLLRIELANPLDKGARTASCVKAAPGLFIAAVEPKVVERWYNANGYWEGETKKLPIGVLFTVGGHAGCRTIWVAMCPIRLEDSGPSDDTSFAWYVEGPCSMPVPTAAPIPSRAGTGRR